MARYGQKRAWLDFKLLHILVAVQQTAVIDAFSLASAFSAGTPSEDIDTAPTQTILPGATVSANSTASIANAPSSSSHHLFRTNLILAIVLPVLVALVAAISLIVYCRRRAPNHTYSDIKHERTISDPTLITGKIPRRSIYGLKAPKRPAELAVRTDSRPTEQSHGRSMAPLSMMLVSPFSTSQRPSAYSHVRTASETDDFPTTMADTNRNTGYMAFAKPAKDSPSGSVEPNPFSDGRASPWTINGRTSPVPSSGRNTPDRHDRKQPRSRQMSTISLPLSPQEDPHRRSSTPLAWSADRIQGDGRGRTTPNPFDGRHTPVDGRDTTDLYERTRSQSRNLSQISLPLSLAEDPASGRASSPLAWSAGRIRSDISGRTAYNPFEISGFTPTATVNPYGNDFGGARGHSRARSRSRDVISAYLERNPLSPTTATVPVILAATPLPTTTTFAAAGVAERAQPSTVDEHSSGRPVDHYLEPTDASQPDVRSRVGTIRSVTTIRSSVDSTMAARLEDMPPLPAGWDAENQRPF